MKILNAAEMRAVDEGTFETTGVSSLAVMESAGRAVVHHIIEHHDIKRTDHVTIVCGAGNNAGDGYVIARTLSNLGVEVSVISSLEVRKLKGDALVNARAFLELYEDPSFYLLDESFLKSRTFQRLLKDSDLIVDCLYGTGFRGSLEGCQKKLVERINENSPCAVVAVDIPSGVQVDSAEIEGIAIDADETLALQYLKPCHVLYPSSISCGEVRVVDIGLTHDLSEEISRELIVKEKVSELLSVFLKSQGLLHKNSKGSVLVVGGSKGMYGAPKLAAEAALVSGAGLVSMALPEMVSNEIAPKQKELMCVALLDNSAGDFSGEDDERLYKALHKKKAVALGPGISTEYGAKLLVEAVLEYTRDKSLPIVVDADALNVISEERALFELLGEHVVLTPHPGEMARLLELTVEEVEDDRLAAANKLAEETGAVVVLKGPRTIVSSPEGEVRINPAAVETLATAGSGDVLTGVISAFLARGLSPFDAATAAVFVHGESGEYLMTRGVVGAIASDIIETLPLIVNYLIELDRDLISMNQLVLNQAKRPDLLAL